MIAGVTAPTTTPAPIEPATPAGEGTPADQIDAFAGDPDFMVSLARGLAVICAFDADHVKLTVAQASERTGLSRSAARRCLYTLQCLGYVGMDGSSFYLKPRIVALGHMHLMRIPISSSAQPALDRVARELGETCTLAVLDEQDIVFVAHSAKTALISVNLAVGSRMPAYATANGRVLLGALPEHDLETYLAKVRLSRLTENTVSGKKELRERIDRARQDGFALVDQEFDLKIRSIAVPLRQGGRIVASMSIAVPAERVSAGQLRTEYLPALCAASAEFA